MLDLSNIWPEWKAVELIGEGSFGKVYKCVREEYGMKFECAVKVISIPASRAEVDSVRLEGLTENEVKSYFNDIVVDFANEVKLMFMLKGAANIVSVENYKIVERQNEVGWDIYILMEYLQSFASYSLDKKFTEYDVKEFALDIINALTICSKYKVIHRDIKPANIFVDRFGSYKLGDFGVARQLDGTGSMLSKKGTVRYMAPEVYKGEKYDFKVDIYSLGMVMYKLLNRNRDPFLDVEKSFVTFRERSESFEKIMRGEKFPAPVDASPEMAAVILKACEYRPEDRFASVEDFKKAVAAIEIKAPQEEPTISAEEKTVAAGTGNEPTVYADEATMLADEATVLADDEPTVFAEDEATVMADEATVLADDATVMADSGDELIEVIGETKNDCSIYEKELSSFHNGSEPEKECKRFNKKYIIVLTVTLVIAIFLFLGLCNKISFGNIDNGTSVKNSSFVDKTSSIISLETTIDSTENLLITNSVIEENTLVDGEKELTREEAQYHQAEELLTHGDMKRAAIMFGSLGNYSDSKERSYAVWSKFAEREQVSVGNLFAVAVRSNGTVEWTGNNDYGQCNVENWTNIIAVSAGYSHTVGLKSDGTVVAVGLNDSGQCNVGSWTDIVAVSAGDYHTVGLKSDGTVVAVGDNEHGRCNVNAWSDIVAVSAGGIHTVALKSDGTVVAVGSNSLHSCNVDGWTNIIAVSTGQSHTVGLKSDGTVIACGLNISDQCDVGNWSDIVAISAGWLHTVGLKSDGTVVAVGYNEFSQCDVDDWTNVVEVSAGTMHTIGIKSDGTAVAVGGSW